MYHVIYIFQAEEQKGVLARTLAKELNIYLQHQEAYDFSAHGLLLRHLPQHPGQRPANQKGIQKDGALSMIES